MKSKKHIIIKVLFYVYVIIMLWLLLGQRLVALTIYNYSEQIKNNINLIPFITIERYLTLIKYTPNLYLAKHAIINLLGNIVMFIPLGIFVPATIKKTRNYLIFILYIIITITLVEVVQLFTLLGSCDIDDLIFNTIGASIGYLIFLIIYRCTHRTVK